jgi:methylthioribose-1-phosphate isomerase
LGGGLVPVRTISWQNRALEIVDQTLLPAQYKRVRLSTLEQVWEAIRSLRVRGAPAIGVCAAFGVIVGVLDATPATASDALTAAGRASARLATARPTGVNLFWALERMRSRAAGLESPASPEDVVAALEQEALAIYEEDREMCRQIGQVGVGLVPEGGGVLTHCNAGGLATSDYGTALAVLFRAHESGRRFEVFAGETRPLLQGSRLTAWELKQAGIPVTVICDNAAAEVMREGRVQLALVGADRIAANGDTANKIGTYSIALLAKAHGIPFYVAAPTSTIDFKVASGADIPIEQRPREEIASGLGRVTVPDDVAVYNPAFDVTPADLISGIITERGIHRPPYGSSLPRPNP